MHAPSIVRSSQVDEATARGTPVVALETTVIAQGLPWPENLETAKAMEAVVREAGAEPSTIAVLDGEIRLGLAPDEILEIAAAAATGTAPGAGPRPWVKANRRDLSAIVAAGGCAATTVSATLWIARRAGLAPGVMATGGLGGVHRDAGTTFDVSTDLDELARADGMLVVCSGMKSILDLPATLESLETRGVPVVGYRTGELPGFVARTSGLALEHRVDSPEEVARLVLAHRALGLPGAKLFAILCHEVGHPEWASDTRFVTNAARVAHRETLLPMIEEALRTATVAHWNERLQTAGVAAAPVNDMAQAFADPQVVHTGQVVTIRHPTVGDVKMVGPALSLSGTPTEIRFPPPLLGQHTDEVLAPAATDAEPARWLNS